jgi:spoIIIJ-associated protein
VDGDNLGLLVGPKGATVEALQELTRTVVQRHTEEHTSRIVVDVGGYRERRAAALRQFVIQAAGDVLRTGEQEALEPMSPSDRKVVHDTVNELEGLETTSEGVEPHRYVLIRRAASSSLSPADGSSEDAADPLLAEPSDPS